MDLYIFESDILQALKAHPDIEIEEMMKHSFNKDDLESLVHKLDLK